MRAIGIRNRQMALFVAGEGYRLRNDRLEVSDDIRSSRPV